MSGQGVWGHPGQAQAALLPLPGPIPFFSGEHRFLSNFWVHEVAMPSGLWWLPEITHFPSTEHAYQAAKVEPSAPNFVEHYRAIADSDSARLAKRLGSRRGFEAAGATLRKDWEEIKVPVMLACLRQKFVPGTALAAGLIDTSPRVLVEGNTWGDVYWGVVDGKGKNMLGRLLMLVRSELTCAAAAGLPVERLR